MRSRYLLLAFTFLVGYELCPPVIPEGPSLTDDMYRVIRYYPRPEGVRFAGDDAIVTM